MSSSPKAILFAGPMLIGYLLNWSLYGFEISQLHTYHISFPKERLRNSWIARLVYTIFLFDTIQILMTTQHAWYTLIVGWGDNRALYNPAGSWIAVPLFTSLNSCMVQLFYARRIKRLKIFGWIVFLISALSVFQAVSGIIFAAQVQILSDFSRVREIATTATLWLGSEALCDLLITSTIVTFLAVKVTGFTQMDTLISKVTRTTAEGGLATTGMTALHLILFLTSEGNNLHMIASIPLSKVYAITLLAMLNARRSKFSLDPHCSKESGVDLESSDPHRLSFGKTSPIRVQHGLQTIRVKLSKEMLWDNGVTPALAPAPAPLSPAPAPTPAPAPAPAPVFVPIASIPIVPPMPTPMKLSPPLPALPLPTYSMSTLTSHSHTNSYGHDNLFEFERPTRAQANADFDSAFIPVSLGRPLSPVRRSHLDLGEPESTGGAGQRFLQKFSTRI